MKPAFPSLLRGISLAAAIACPAVAADSTGVVFGATGWVEHNVIGNSSLGGGDYTGKGVFSTGAQIEATRKVSDKLVVKAGVGLASDNSLILANSGYGTNSYAVPTLNPYVYEADFAYTFLEGERGGLKLRGGIFPYSYSSDVKNLGLYLMRGPVHPGIVISGHERQGVMPVANLAARPAANVMGLQLNHRLGAYEGDAIVSSELQYYPFFDLSFVYVGSYRPHPGIRLGAGVNFYHLVAVDSKLSDEPAYRHIDGSDTTDIYYHGTKLMANASFDPKEFFGRGLVGVLGAEDLKLYGEVAVIGLETSSGYESIYGTLAKRIPVMVGFNVPAFGYLDHVSVEVEYYGSRNADDLSNFNKGEYSPLPRNWSPTTPQDFRRDDWKWSVNAARTFHEHVTLTAQIANDHYRPGIYRGYTDSNLPLRQTLTVTPKDWYSSLKVAYSF
jgi:hypothetical protein